MSLALRNSHKEAAIMFENKIVAITGAARGIGEVLTRAFLGRGAKVVAMDLA